jgi:hypothetical protein
MMRLRARHPGRSVLAAALICALLVFTAVYRNSSGFSPATGGRCHSLSTDHTSARALFAGDFGPLAVLFEAPLTPARAECPLRVAAAPRPAPERPVAQVTAPFRRPPPADLL